MNRLFSDVGSSVEGGGSREAELGDWDDWRWQLRHAVRSAAELARHLTLTPEELEGALNAERQGLPLAITPHVLSLCDKEDPRCPIRLQVVPRSLERREVEGDLRGL